MRTPPATEPGVPVSAKILLVCGVALWSLQALVVPLFWVAAAAVTLVAVVVMTSVSRGRSALLAVLAIVAPLAPWVYGAATQNEDWAFVVSLFLVGITAPSLLTRWLIGDPTRRAERAHLVALRAELRELQAETRSSEDEDQIMERRNGDVENRAPAPIDDVPVDADF